MRIGESDFGIGIERDLAGIGDAASSTEGAGALSSGMAGTKQRRQSLRRDFRC